MLIINADDFGKDSLVNKAIISSFERGFCSHATIMPNMPGFEEACQLAHEDKLADYIGLHLVLDGAYPLTEKIKRYPKLCNNNGQLCLGQLKVLKRAFLMLESSEKAALAEEMRVQIRKCRAQNMPLTHIDSHHHIHTAWAVASVLIRIAKEEGIHFIRIARNLGPDSNVFKTIYKHVFNDKLKMLNLAHTDYFGSIDDLLLLKKQDGIPDILHSCEIMIHPTFNNENALVDKHSIIIKRTLEDLIAEINDFKSIVSFNGSKYQR